MLINVNSRWKSYAGQLGLRRSATERAPDSRGKNHQCSSSSPERKGAQGILSSLYIDFAASEERKINLVTTIIQRCRQWRRQCARIWRRQYEHMQKFLMRYRWNSNSTRNSYVADGLRITELRAPGSRENISSVVPIGKGHIYEYNWLQLANANLLLAKFSTIVNTVLTLVRIRILILHKLVTSLFVCAYCCD